jgi:hypothetical protein
MKGPGMGSDEIFPRDLSALERELLLWILPADRSGYDSYRSLVEAWKIAARGRRGEGNYILARDGAAVDNESPLPQLLAYGSVQLETGEVTVSLRERLDDQLEFEIAGEYADAVAGLQASRRWTLSTWLPSGVCPCCGGSLREVEMKTGSGRRLVLALCVKDRRLWVYDDRTGVNHPIPVTSFYNELMLQQNVKDPAIALDWRRLFTALGTFRDIDLSLAFMAYNRLRTKVILMEPLELANKENLGWFARASRWLKKM